MARIKTLKRSLEEVMEEKNKMQEEMADFHINRNKLKIKLEGDIHPNKSDLEMAKLKKLRNQVEFSFKIPKFLEL